VAPGAVELATCSGRPGTAGVARVRPICPDDRSNLAGLPVTSVTRTLLDLGQVVDDDVVERALEWVLRKGHASVVELQAAVDRASGQRGTRALRRLLALRPADLPPTESDAETLFVQLARAAGLPEPHRQFAVPTVEGLFRLDFAWPARRLAVEVDGAATHASAAALGRDLRRQNRVVLSLGPVGWVLLRFTWDDITRQRHAGQVAAILREAWGIGVNSGR
jgi:very-short-patch-repair endonuclease